MEGPKPTTSSTSTSNIGDDIRREVEELMVMMGPVKVMTDEQIEVLRQQISMFAIICEQLVEMHKSITARQDAIAGMSLGNQYCDPLMVRGGTPKFTTRQRWTPTPVQLQILESIFELGTGTPSKQKVKEITSELSQHGQISEANVYNWFQNRRARSKRKQLAAAPRLSIESEAEIENECSKFIKGKSDQIGFLRSPERSSELQSVCPDSMKTQGMSYISNDSLQSSCSIRKVLFYESAVPDTRVNQVMGEMEIPEGLSYFQPGNRYNMTG